MPIYEYKCGKCGHTFEVMQKVSDPPILTCTKCLGPTSKIISPAGLMFKGSGWYVTDYSSKGKAGREGTGTEKAAPEKKEDKAEKKEGKKETKTAT